MRASRLLSILLLLQARGRLTAQQLAEELEVSVRTIYRDMDALHAAGVPLYGDAGPAGGYQLLDGFRTRLTGLTTDEAESLFLAGLPDAAAGLGRGESVSAAQRKLQAALPGALRDRATRSQKRFHLDAPGWYFHGDRPEQLKAVADAVWEQRRIIVRYESWRETVRRLLDPYGIVLKAGKWYVVARCDERFRTYRVSQILDLTATEETFDRLADFDLVRYWSEYLAEFRSRLYQGEATVRLSPAGERRLREIASSDVIKAFEETATSPDPDGWVTAVVPIESLDHAQGELLRLGGQAEVLSPLALRERMETAARELAGLYRCQRDGTSTSSSA